MFILSSFLIPYVYHKWRRRQPWRNSRWDASVCVTVCRSVQMVTRGNHHCWSVQVTWGWQASALWPGDDSCSGLWSRKGKWPHKRQGHIHIHSNAQASTWTNGTSTQRNTFHTNLAPWDCERLWGGASGTERKEVRKESGGNTERDRHIGFQCSLINEVTPNTSKHTNHTHTCTHTTVTLT